MTNTGAIQIAAEGEYDDTLSILNERARMLGRVQEQGGEGPTIQALVFRLGGELYAAEIGGLRSVEYVDDLAPLPCTPDFVAGAMNLRGEVITVLNLAVALGVHRSPASDGRVCIVVAERSGVRAGWKVDEVIGVESLAVEDLAPSASGRESTRGVARAEVALLDLHQLMTSERFDVNEEVT